MTSVKRSERPQRPVSQKTLNRHFIKSVKNQDIAAMREHLANGADVNAQDRRGIIPLEMVAMSGTAKALALLFRYGADPHHVSQGDQTALMLTARKGKVEVARLLLKYGVDINACDADGKTAMDIAMEHEHVDMLNFLAPHTNSLLANVTFYKNYKKRPSPKPEPIQLPSRAVSKRTLNRYFLKAAEQGDYAAVKALLNAGANIEAKDSYWGALIHASDHIRTLTFLLRNGADPNSKNFRGRTPLIQATFDSRPVAVQKLLAAGGDPNQSDDSGQVPLHFIKIFASKEVPSREELVRLLLDGGANPNAQDDHGDTLLHLISSGLFLGVVQLLLAAKADPNIQNNQGQTALEAIQESFREEDGEEYLHEGETFQSREALVALLKAHGAIARPPQKKPETRLDHLQIIFDNTPVPKPLKELCKFEETLRQNGRSLGFVFGFVLRQAAAKEDDHCPSNCLPFARARGCQIYFALWQPTKKTPLTKAPVVMYGEDLGSPAQVIAEDIHDLLSLLLSAHRAFLLQDLEAHPERLAQVKANYQRSPSALKELQEVSRQLRKKFALKQIRNPGSYIRRCRKRYPEVE